MPSTLATLRDRVEASLMDSSNLSWDTATLDEAIRQALTFVTKARTPPSAFTISGLDGAANTTMAEDDTAYLVIGAAGFAARSRAVNRSQTANLEQAMPSALLTWSTSQLDAFFFGLGLKSSATSTTGGSDALDIATLQAASAELIAAGHDSNAVTLLQMQIEAAVAAVTAANTRADSKAATEAARKAALQTANTSPHSPLDWIEPKRW